MTDDTERPPQGHESISEETELPHIRANIDRFFKAVEDGKDVTEEYNAILETIPEKDHDLFNQRLKGKADILGYVIKLPSDPDEPAVPGIVAQEESAREPVVAITTTEEATEATEAKEAAEWQLLKKERPSGDGTIDGRKYWKAPDGSGYIQAMGRTPIRVVHGEMSPNYRIRRTGERTNSFWDGTKGVFVKEDPTPEVREERKRARAAMRSAVKKTEQWAQDKTESAADVLSDQERESTQAQILSAMEGLKISDDKRVEIERGVAAISTKDHATEIIDLLARFPEKSDPIIDIVPEHDPIKSGDGGYADGASSLEREAERIKALRGLLLKTGTGFRLVHHSGNTTGRGATGEDYYEHDAMPGEKFSVEEVNAAIAARLARGGNREKAPKPEPTPGKVARGVEKEPEADAEKPNWDVKISAFRDLKPKQFDQLIHGPDQLGFSMLVESLDPGALEIKRKLQEGILISKDEEKILNYARYEYARRMQQVEFIYGKLNVADLEVAGRHNEDFASLLQFRGTARTLELFKKQVLQMGMKNREGLDALYNTYENLTHLRDKTIYRVWEKGVQDLCMRRGITMDYYDATFKTGTKEQRVATRREIQKEIRHGWGPFMRVLDKATGTSFRRADRMVQRATLIGEAVRDLKPIRQVHDEMDSLTNILKFTMVDNDEVRLLIQQEAVRNEKLNTSAENGPHTFAEAKKAEVKSSADMKADFDKVVKEFKTKDGRRDWDHATVDERTEGLGALRQARAKEERQSGQGWFARACLAIARAAFGQKEEEIINKPTLK